MFTKILRRALFGGAIAFLGMTAAIAEPIVHYPDTMFWSSMDPQLASRHQALVGKPMPWIELSDWHNRELTKEDLEGKVVLVNLWATWCGPCIAGIPKFNQLYQTYNDQGLEILAICTSRNGQERLGEIVQTHGILYPTARDHTLDAQLIWNVQFYPTYAIVGRDGLIKGVGFNPTVLEDVIKAELSGEGAAAFAPPTVQGAAPEAFLEGGAARREAVAHLVNQQAPPIELTDWLNSEPLSNDFLMGKIVVLDFWATWCGPCINSIPKNNEIAAKYADNGVVFIGVCHHSGSERMEEVAKEHGIRFPIAIDGQNRLSQALMVDGYPDYYIINRDGTLWGVDIANNQVAAALDYLLASEAGN